MRYTCRFLGGLEFIINKANEDLKEKAMTKRSLVIEGMHDAQCLRLIYQVLSSLPGANEVSVSLEEKKATVVLPDLIDDATLKTLLEQRLNYKVLSIKEESEDVA